jgi:NAD-dependent DNA ligase
MTLKEMVNEGRLDDIFILARFMYRIGEPILSDEVYSKLELHLQKKFSPKLKDYFERTYDDDPVPEDLLSEINYKYIPPVQQEGREDLIRYLDEEKSFSIDSVTNYRDAYSFFSRYREEKQDLMVSIKLDGINTKTLFLDGQLRLSLSRGRSGNGFDLTDNIVKSMIYKVSDAPDEMKVFSEAYVDFDYLPALRQKYNPDGYKTPKSAAISLLRVKHDIEDYEHLNVTTFAVDGIGSSVDEIYKKAEEMGFNVVPHKLIKWQDIPEGLDEFVEWSKAEIFDYFAKMAFNQNGDMIISSDGIVVEVNDKNYTPVQTNQYIDTQLALKFEQWGFLISSGIIEEIICEQQRVLASCRIRIKPTLTQDGCKAEYINGFNHSILVKEGLKIGSRVYFERNAGAVNILVYGDRLKRMLVDGQMG